MSSRNVVLAFDVYGTLLSTQSIAEKLARHFGDERAKTVAQTWRKYQLEYTWRLNSMGQYQPFSEVTRNSLVHSLGESSLALDDSEIDELMQAYNSLTAFPDAAECLRTLSSSSPGKQDIRVVAFSNGTHEMVSQSLQKSPDLAPLASTISDVITVEQHRRYKPAPEVYAGLVERVSQAATMAEVWVVSGNPFDIVGARSFGLNAIWVDREGHGWVDRLATGDKGRPTAVVNSLVDVLAVVSGSAAK